MYRDNALPATDELHAFDVSTHRGLALVILLAVVAMFALVVGGITIFAGGPPVVQPWKWPIAAIGMIALVGTVKLHLRRRRRMVITRTGDRHRLVIAAEGIELEFPLRVSGSQEKAHVGRLPLYHVLMKLSDERGHALLLREVRGGLSPGAQPGWFTAIDDETPCEMFDVGKVDDLAKLRGIVAALNPPSAD